MSSNRIVHIADLSEYQWKSHCRVRYPPAVAAWAITRHAHRCPSHRSYQPDTQRIVNLRQIRASPSLLFGLSATRCDSDYGRQDHFLPGVNGNRALTAITWSADPIRTGLRRPRGNAMQLKDAARSRDLFPQRGAQDCPRAPFSEYCSWCKCHYRILHGCVSESGCRLNRLTGKNVDLHWLS
jgi:hypothetical protein